MKTRKHLFLATVARLGLHGGLLRDPNGHTNDPDAAAFAEFEAAGEVEVGASNKGASNKGDDTPPAPKPKPNANRQQRRAERSNRAEPKSDDDAGDDGDDGQQRGADDNADDDEGDDDEGDDGAGDDGEARPKKQKASERIRDLTKRIRQRDRLIDQLSTRLDNIEKNGLPSSQGGDNQNPGTPAPDPSDTVKYPLGHLDDRYIEDKLDWLAEKKATERADAVLQRQQENERTQAAQREQQALLDRVDDLAAKGSEIYDDFQETVVEAGMKGEWDLSQPTFEACEEATNGVQILYELSQDPKEATRIAKLSPYQQLKFVQERDVEISKGKAPRRIPKAGEPPKNVARGANSRTHINPATDNLDDFEKAWEADARKSR